ncbi:MAG: MFS transporter [Candidatus Limnocylindria bacterium]
MTSSRPVSVAVMALAHLVNDSYAYLLPALLPLLLTRLGLTLGLAGLLVTIYQVSSSFAQPVFGHIADRGTNTRWMAWTGVACSGVAAGSLGLAPSFGWIAAALLAGGLGTALYHPVSAALVARAVPDASRGRWMSLYISAGNFGLPIGPLAVGVVFATIGLGGTWLLAFPALVMSLIVWRSGPQWTYAAHGSAQLPLRTVLAGNRRMLAPLIGVAAGRSWASTLVASFLPIIAVARGADVVTSSRLLTAFLLAGAFGGLIGGALADRVGRDRVIVAGLLAGAPACVALALQPRVDAGFWAAAIVSGLLLNGSFVVLAVRGQESMPGNLGMVSGLMLGLSIGLGGLAVAPMAALAERTGLDTVLYASAFLALAAALLMTAVPKPPPRSLPAVAPAPVG